MMGHKLNQRNTQMRDWYSGKNTNAEKIIEEQMKVFPNGPLGKILQPETPKIDGIPDEWSQLWYDLNAGNKTIADVQNEAVRLLLANKDKKEPSILTK